MIRLHHPETGHVHEAANAAVARIMAKSGWVPLDGSNAPEPANEPTATESTTSEPEPSGDDQQQGE